MKKNSIKFLMHIFLFSFFITDSMCMEKDHLPEYKSFSNPQLIQKYSNILDINLTNDKFIKPSIESLKEIVSNHVKKIPYQNFEIYFHHKNDISKECLSIENLQKKLLDEKRGGSCYETSELLFYTLYQLDYNIKRIPVFPLNINNQEIDINNISSSKSTHNILIVELNNDLMLVDVGYGLNSIRYPLKFSFKETETNEIFSHEEYQLFVNKDYYQLNLKIKSQWAPLYYFSNPLTYIEKDETGNNFINLLTSDNSIPIRDTYIKTSILTDEGRIGFYINPTEDITDISHAHKIIQYSTGLIKKGYKTLDEFKKDVYQTMNLSALDKIN